MNLEGGLQDSAVIEAFRTFIMTEEEAAPPGLENAVLWPWRPAQLLRIKRLVSAVSIPSTFCWDLTIGPTSNLVCLGYVVPRRECERDES